MLLVTRRSRGTQSEVRVVLRPLAQQGTTAALPVTSGTALCTSMFFTYGPSACPVSENWAPPTRPWRHHPIRTPPQKSAAPFPPAASRHVRPPQHLTQLIERPCDALRDNAHAYELAAFGIPFFTSTRSACMFIDVHLGMQASAGFPRGVHTCCETAHQRVLRTGTQTLLDALALPSATEADRK